MTMTTRVIRYQAKAERADENQKLIEAVFQELAEKQPPGVNYTSVRLEDDTFIHTVETEGEDPLSGIEAFQRFQEGIRDRLVDRPTLVEATVVGRYVAPA